MALVLLALVAGAGPAGASPLRGVQRLFKDWGLFQGVRITGQNSLTFQQNYLQGSQTAFQGQRWDTQPMIRTSSVSLEGPVWKEFAFKADLSATGYGPSYARWVVGYVGHDTAVYFGDLNIDLSGNQFATFSKQVTGWQVDERIGRGLARAFYSQEKSITRYQRFAGNNTSGPFFLTFTPVMDGTEVVRLDEQVQVFGRDYSLDYQTGQLRFQVEGNPPKIIPDTATVAVSYQSSSYLSDSGTLSGARVELPLMGERMRIGATMIRQQRGGGGAVRDNVGYQEDIFQGSGSTGPFDVNYRPIMPNGSQVVYKGKAQMIQQALTVLVDSVEQAEGVDYDSYRQIGRIIFRRSVPPTALVVIRYFYDLSTSTAAGDKSVTGLDLLYHFTPKMNVQAEWGRSDGGQTSNTGDAFRANLSYNASRLRMMAEYRDTSPTFGFLDSVGFYRHDKGLDLMTNWRVSDHINLTARRSDLKSGEGYSFGYSPYSGGQGFGNSGSLTMGTAQTSTQVTALDISSVQDDLELRLDFPGWPSLAVRRHELSNTRGSSGDSGYMSTSYQLNYSPSGKPYSFTAGLNDSDQSYVQPSTGTTSGGSGAAGSKTRQLLWSASYRPGSRLSLSLSQGNNTSQATNKDNTSSSSSSQFTLRWAPSSKLDFTWDRALTSSLGSVSSGFYGNTYNTYGVLGTYGINTALNPGGGGGGSGGGGSTGTSRYADNSSRLSMGYRPSGRLNLDLSLSKRTYTSGGSVGYLADSDQLTRSLSAMWQLNSKLSLSATLGVDNMKFLDAGRGEVANDIMTVGANYRVPDSPWGLAASYNRQNGTSPTYSGFGSSQTMRIVANNLSDLRGQITYALGEDSDLVLSGGLSRYIGGYANFSKQEANIGYRRRIGKLADVTFGYRYIRNLSGGQTDPRYGNTSLTPMGQNYIANTFLLTFSTQFSSSLGTAGSGFTDSGGYGGASLSNFGGYRAGPNLGGGGGSSYGTGYGSFEQMRSFNQYGGSGGGFSTSPFGSFGGAGGQGSYGGYGGSGGYGGYGGSGGYGGYGGYGGTQGSSTFGGNFGGFTTGLGDFSGKGQQGDRGGPQGMFGPVETGGGLRPGAPGTEGLPAAPGEPGAPGTDDWQLLDDLRSIWW
jgi:hypothetical protein